MAAANIVVSTQSWGYYVTCTAGTGSAALVTASVKNSSKICGIAVGGSAGADVVTVYDGNGITPIFSGLVGTLGQLATLQLAAPIRTQGISVSFAGGTNGQCYIYTCNS